MLHSLNFIYLLALASAKTFSFSCIKGDRFKICHAKLVKKITSGSSHSLRNFYGSNYQNSG